jgi:hypothetical protein
MSGELKELQEKVNSLSVLVERQAKMIAETGQQLVSLQVKDVKTRMADLDMNTKNSKSGVSHEDLQDYVTHEDIVELVGELQGQLDSIEERNIRRVFNSQLSQQDGIIAPLTNKNGELPIDINFPKTLQEFINIDSKVLIQLGIFYEYVIAKDQIENFENFANDNSNNVEKTKQALLDQSSSAHVNDPDISLTEEELNLLFDDVSRYLGLKVRRDPNAW